MCLALSMRFLPILVLLAACGDDGSTVDAFVADASPRDGATDSGRAGDAALEVDASAADASADAGARLGAAAWIRMHFADAPTLDGSFERRTRVETPALIDGADACCAKYAFDAVEEEAPDLPEIGFIDVEIHDLVSGDAFGGGVQVSRAAGATLFLSAVTIDPGWPEWVSYDSTNYDGMVLDDAQAIYAEDLTIRDWNADGAIDNKAQVSQFVRLTIEGRGHRGIRYWRPGPHYLVESSLENTGGLGEGSVLWFRDCDSVELRVWDTTFNGDSTVPPGAVACDDGSDPTIVHLGTDPRTTGELHEMFTH